MANRATAREQPVVRSIADQEHVRRRGLAREVPPAVRDNAARAGLVEGGENGAAEGGRVFDDDGTEADIDRRLPGREKVEKRPRRLIRLRLVVEGEVREVYVRAPVRRFGNEAMRPEIRVGHLIVIE
jgi:hypothetical protein